MKILGLCLGLFLGLCLGHGLGLGLFLVLGLGLGLGLYLGLGLGLGLVLGVGIDKGITMKQQCNCNEDFNCCDCGILEKGCGCAYCFSCNACDNCTGRKEMIELENQIKNLLQKEPEVNNAGDHYTYKRWQANVLELKIQLAKRKGEDYSDLERKLEQARYTGD